MSTVQGVHGALPESLPPGPWPGNLPSNYLRQKSLHFLTFRGHWDIKFKHSLALLLSVTLEKDLIEGDTIPVFQENSKTYLIYLPLNFFIHLWLSTWNQYFLAPVEHLVINRTSFYPLLSKLNQFLFLKHISYRVSSSWLTIILLLFLGISIVSIGKSFIGKAFVGWLLFRCSFYLYVVMGLVVDLFLCFCLECMFDHFSNFTVIELAVDLLLFGLLGVQIFWCIQALLSI